MSIPKQAKRLAEEWQPIETLDTDRAVLIWDTKWHPKKAPRARVSWRGGPIPKGATHWMHLPSKPVEQAE